MKPREYRFTLDCSKIGNQLIKEGIRQGDNDNLIFIINLANFSEEYDINGAGVEARLIAKKPDGTVIYKDCAIDDNGNVIIALQSQATTCTGTVYCQIEIVKFVGDEKTILCSPEFAYVVESKLAYPVYRVLESQPENWNTEYKKYFVHTENGYEAIASENVPEWIDNTFYYSLSPVESTSEFPALINAIKQIAKYKEQISELVSIIDNKKVDKDFISTNSFMFDEYGRIFSYSRDTVITSSSFSLQDKTSNNYYIWLAHSVTSISDGAFQNPDKIVRIYWERDEDSVTVPETYKDISIRYGYNSLSMFYVHASLSKLLNEKADITKLNDFIEETQAKLDNKLDDSDKSVKSNNLADEAVTSDKLSDNAVTSAKIADGAVSRGKIGYEAISDSHQIASGVVKGYNPISNTIGHIAKKTITSYELADEAVTTERIATGAVTSDKIMDRSIEFEKLDKDTMIDTSSNSSMAYALASDTHIPTTGFIKAINEGTKEKIDTEIAQVNESIDNLFVKKELLVNLSSFKDESTGDYINKGRYYYNPTDKVVGISNDSNYACIPVELKAGTYSVQNINPYYSFYIINNTVTRLGTAENAFISTTFELPIDTTLYVTIRVVSSSNGHETVAIASGDSIPDDISTLGVFSYDTAVELDSVTKLEEKIPTLLTVKKDGTGDFSTLKEAVDYSRSHSDLTIEVYEGTYDLIEEFGEEYFTNLSGTSQRRGLQIGNGVHLIFSSGSKVVCHYQGNNETVKTCFSPFNYIQGTKGFTLENLTLEASNVRYAIHDEAGSSTLNMYRNTYKNCKITIDNSNNEVWKHHQCIGGGLGLHGEIIIENCSFTDMYNIEAKVSAVSYHNVVSEGAKSRIIVTGCYFSDNATFSLAYYGNSTEITEAYVSNCYMTYEPYVRAETSEYTTENVKLIMWNNEIRNM